MDQTLCGFDSHRSLPVSDEYMITSDSRSAEKSVNETDANLLNMSANYSPSHLLTSNIDLKGALSSRSVKTRLIKDKKTREIEAKYRKQIGD